MKKIICLCTIVIFALLLIRTSRADELSDLKAQQAEMLKQMSAMQEKIEELVRKEESRLPMDHTNQGPLINKIEELETDISFLQEQQDNVFTRLGENIEFDLYTTVEYEDFHKTDSLIDAKNLELLASVHLNDRLMAFAEIEFERTAKTSSGSRQGEVEVEQSWLEYSINEYFNPRVGVILVPFGKYNAEHFEPFRDLTDRPIVMRRVVPATWAEAGIGFTGSAFPGQKLDGLFGDLTLDYQFFMINGLSNEFTDTGIRNARGAFGRDSNNNKAMVGRLGIMPSSNTEIGVSGYYGDYDSKDHKMSGFDVDWKFTKGPFELLGEYAIFDLEHGGVESDGTTQVPDYMHGVYIQANYHFWFDFLNNTFLGRDFDGPTFTSVLRYDKVRIDDDGDVGTGANREERLTIGLNYRPVETWVLKLDYQFNRTKNETLERGDNDGLVISVSAAIETLEKFDYDLILMDCQMPEMDGYEATNIIRSENSAVRDHNVPIIAMMANAMKGDREKCIEAGMDDYVTKPVDVTELDKAIARNLSNEKKQQLSTASIPKVTISDETKQCAPEMIY